MLSTTATSGDGRAEVVLGAQNRALRDQIIAHVPDVQRYIAGVVARAGLHDPPRLVWVHLLFKQLQGGADDTPVRYDTLARHIAVLERHGDLIVTLDVRNGRTCHILTATPALLADARLRASARLALMRATVLACDRLDETYPTSPTETVRFRTVLQKVS